MRPVLLFAALLSCQSFATNGQFSNPTRADELIHHMTLRQKVGQLLIFGYAGTTADESLKHLLEQQQPGALITFGRNIKDLPQIAELNRQAQAWSKSISKVPLLVMVDQEGGNVARLKVRRPLPSALALGETKDLDLIQQYGEALGQLMRHLGFNVNLAPVLDLSDPNSISFIGPRSFGVQPNDVGHSAFAFARGLALGGVIPTAKHFPGHGGIVQDSHRETPKKLSTLEELIEGDLVPFQKFAGADFPRAVMMAHIAYPQIDPSGSPAAFSPVFIQDVLRKKFRYDGLVITDDVEMSGANAAGSIEDRVVRAIEAGNDMVMVAWSVRRQRRAVEALLTAIRSGRISEARVDQSLKRILNYKFHLESRDHDGATLATDQGLLERLAEKVKRFNFIKTANGNRRLRGSQIGRSTITIFSSDPRFFAGFRQRYGQNVKFVRLTQDSQERLQEELLQHPDQTFIYYASGAQTARWVNQLTSEVKRRIIVVNTNQPGAINNAQVFSGVFQLNTSAPESGAWLAQFLTDPTADLKPFRIGEK